MHAITRTVVTVEITPRTLPQGRAIVDEAQLDGDEGLQVGDEVLLRDGAGTYRAATVIEIQGDRYELTLTR